MLSDLDGGMTGAELVTRIYDCNKLKISECSTLIWVLL